MRPLCFFHQGQAVAIPVAAMAPAPNRSPAAAAAPHQSPTLLANTVALQSQTAATEALPALPCSALASATARPHHHQLALTPALQGLLRSALPGYRLAGGGQIGEGSMGWEDQILAGGKASAEPLVQLGMRIRSWPLPGSAALQHALQGTHLCAKPPARCSMLLSKGMCILASEHGYGDPQHLQGR